MEEEYRAYEDSLKHYRDLKNTIDTAFDDGKIIGIEQGIEKERAVQEELRQRERNKRSYEKRREKLKRNSSLKSDLRKLELEKKRVIRLR